MPGPALIISIIGDASKLSGALGKADSNVQAFGKSIDLGMVAKVAGVASVAGLAASALFDMGKAAGQDRAEQQRLMTAIQAAGAAHGDYAAQVDAAIAAGQEKAFTDTQTRDALTSLVTATGDVTSATGLLSTAQDVARFAGVDLSTAADAVAKAQAGQATQLSRLMPGLEKGASATDTLANAQRMAAGQADAFANSTEGQMARSSDAFAELGETIGSAVLPILDALLPALIPVIQALSKLVQAVLPVLIPLVKLLAQALTIVAQAVAKVANFLADMIQKAQEAIAAIGRFVDSLPSLPSFSLPFSLGAAVPTGEGVGLGRAAGGGGLLGTRGAGGMVVNIYGGDPTRVEAAVATALRNYTRRNGPLGLAGMAGR